MARTQNTVFRLAQGEKIGSGTFGLVYQARDTETGRLVALKKSRASIKLKRTALLYEACVLKRLAGHPSIPLVFAYGRLPHFEYLAMELLGHSLGDTVEEKGKLNLEHVLGIADQIISCLEHIHKHGIVHRDIKPENILLHKDQSSVVRLIDFGMSRPCLGGTPKIREPSIAHNFVVGTLPYASLNSHEGIDLNPRDDLESLAYTLIFLLKGSLPWQKHGEHGTVLGQITQVREKKRTWTGSRLAEYCPPEFGQLVDYARGLTFTESIDYDRLRAQFSSIHKTYSIPSEPKDPATDLSQAQPQCPVEIGHLVCVQILARTSIEGYSLQGLVDPWRDPLLSSKQFTTSARPAIIIDTTYDRFKSLFKVLVVSLGQGPPVNPAIPAKGVSGHISLSNDPSQPSTQGETVVLRPAWPMSDTYCYAFPRASWFYCLPDQTVTRGHWKVDPEDLQVLRQKFATPFPRIFSTTSIPDPVLRYETRMVLQGTKIFATITSLDPSNLNSEAIDWRGDRGFFDESITIARRRGLEDGYFQWTGAPVDPDDDGNDAADSYFAPDISMWGSPQGERPRELTLGQGHDGPLDDSGELGQIVEVI